MNKLAQSYGLSVGEGVGDATIELVMAFEPRLRESAAHRGRYYHLRRAIDLLWNEPRRVRGGKEYDPRKHDAYIWNEWSELMMKTFCDEAFRTITGPNACVAGHTRILNPITGETPTIQELCETGTAPVVMTLDGPEQADVPFLKGTSDLYEVCLSDGSRFTATPEHRVLNAEGDFVNVASLSIGSRLSGYSHTPLETTSGNAPSIRDANVRHSPKTVGGFRCGYRWGSHYDDEPLPSEANIDRVPVPSQADVPMRIPTGSHGDGRSHEFSRTHVSSPLLHHSNFRSVPDALPCGTVHAQEHRSGSASLLLYDVWCRSVSQYPSALSDQTSPIPKPSHDSSHTLRFSDLGAYPKIQTQTVVSIKRTGHDKYYDITVPVAAHYFAEGSIHHNSWKSTSAALYHLCAWLASPSNTLVIVTSTDRLGLKARFWREVTKYYRMLPPEYIFGNLVQSDIALQTRKGDYEAGIFGVATGQDNDVDKAVAKIVGRHNTYTYAVVDEMQATNEGLVKGAISLEAGSDRFEFTGIGNAQSELDPHGTESEPKEGWDSISDDDEVWETKRGVCIHLDGLRCPRVLEGDQYYPGLLRQEHIDNTIRDFGEDSPEFWSTRRGFWAPQGVTKTVLTVADVEKFRAKDKAIFAGKYIWGAALDPAFEGGDRCVLRIGREGEFDDGIVGMELTETVVIKVKASDPLPIHYQITHAVREECEKRSIEPKMFALDTTGEGGGLASIMMQEWSRNILHVEFGGKPSNRPISPDDKKTADKEYQNRVSELWFWFRVLVRRGMIRGLDIDTLREFCQRRWKMKGLYKMVEPKEDMKLRTHRSPDFADAAVILAELFHERGHLNPGRIKSETSTDWSQLAKRYNNVQSGYLINA